jgi:hypothetical protein
MTFAVAPNLAHSSTGGRFASVADVAKHGSKQDLPVEGRPEWSTRRIRRVQTSSSRDRQKKSTLIPDSNSSDGCDLTKLFPFNPVLHIVVEDVFPWQATTSMQLPQRETISLRLGHLSRMQETPKSSD